VNVVSCRIIQIKYYAENTKVPSLVRLTGVKNKVIHLLLSVPVINHELSALL
jgi:hypothetical protein